MEESKDERHQLNGPIDHQRRAERGVSSAPVWSANHSVPPPPLVDLREASRSLGGVTYRLSRGDD